MNQAQRRLSALERLSPRYPEREVQVALERRLEAAVAAGDHHRAAVVLAILRRTA